QSIHRSPADGADSSREPARGRRIRAPGSPAGTTEAASIETPARGAAGAVGLALRANFGPQGQRYSKNGAASDEAAPCENGSGLLRALIDPRPDQPDLFVAQLFQTVLVLR